MERIQNEYTLHTAVKADAPPHACRPRTIKCDGGDWDIVECHICGRQWKTRCNFDDDYS